MLLRMFSVVFILSLFVAVTAIATVDKPAHPDQIARINVVDLRALQSQESVVFVDTRTAGQWQQAVDKIPGALRITTQAELDEFKRRVPIDTVVVAYCT